MSELKIGLVQMNIALAQVEKNVEKAEKYVQEAAAKGVRLLVLPELWTTGYALENIAALSEEISGYTAQRIASWAQTHQMCIVAGSIPIRRSHGVTNTTLVFDQMGNMVAQYDKVHLFQPMAEDQYLLPGDNTTLVDLWGWKCGLMICYDLRFPELSRALTNAGAELLIMPSEFPEPRIGHWQTLIKARAIENQLFFLGVNRVGQDNQNQFFGHSMAVGPWGEVLNNETDQEELIVVTISKSQIIEARNKIPCLRDRRPEVYR